MTPPPITDTTPVNIMRAATWYELDGVTVNSTGHTVDWSYSPYGVGNKRAFYGSGGSAGKLFLTIPSATTPIPTTDCTAAVKAATDPLNAQVAQLQAANLAALAKADAAAVAERERIADAEAARIQAI